MTVETCSLHTALPYANVTLHSTCALDSALHFAACQLLKLGRLQQPAGLQYNCRMSANTHTHTLCVVSYFPCLYPVCLHTHAHTCSLHILPQQAPVTAHVGVAAAEGAHVGADVGRLHKVANGHPVVTEVVLHTHTHSHTQYSCEQQAGQKHSRGRHCNRHNELPPAAVADQPQPASSLASGENPQTKP